MSIGSRHSSFPQKKIWGEIRSSYILDNEVGCLKNMMCYLYRGLSLGGVPLGSNRPPTDSILPPGSIKPLISAWFFLHAPAILFLFFSHVSFYKDSLHCRPSGRVFFYRGSPHLTFTFSSPPGEKWKYYFGGPRTLDLFCSSIKDKPLSH